jgi:hypothetical protein
VEHVLTSSPQALSRLVRAELTAPLGDEPVGIHLVASGIKTGRSGRPGANGRDG